MLNFKQNEVLESAANRIVVNASAGTGKTHTLISIANDNPFQKTILITFTNKAADEMKARIAYAPYFIGTIHKFSLSELIELAKKHNFRIRIMKDPTVKKIIKMLFEENDLGIYVSNVLLSECFNYIMQGETEFDKRKTKIFNEIRRLYKLYKEQNQLYDYTDTPKYLLKKLQDYNIELNMDLVLVDEAQDLDEIQYELIQRLGRRIVVIGDPKQSIYLFRGATPQIFNRFVEDGYQLYELEENYRSKQEIIDYVGIDLRCTRGHGGAVINDVSILKYGPQILCRTNEQVKTIEQYYPAVSTIHAAKGLEYNNVAVVYFEIENEEDENIMFVALTRAKDRVGIVKFYDILKYLETCVENENMI